MSSVTDGAPFRGPFADGPPPEALLVRTAPLELYGLAEFRQKVLKPRFQGSFPGWTRATRPEGSIVASSWKNFRR